jgi:hypothetical protein
MFVPASAKSAGRPQCTVAHRAATLRRLLAITHYRKKSCGVKASKVGRIRINGIEVA